MAKSTTAKRAPTHTAPVSGTVATMPVHVQAHHHDHAPCLAQSLSRAERTFIDQGLKMTPLRRRVLEEVAGSHDAVGAYDVLDALSRKTGTRVAPISVYRALDVLQSAGVIHRVESRNAFFACHADHGARQRPVVLVCDDCRGVTEVVASAAFAPIDAVAAAHGFRTRHTVIEVAGACSTCAAAPAESRTDHA
jgi:Fur family transcriptional regulator, zinc uptake regulator